MDVTDLSIHKEHKKKRLKVTHHQLYQSAAWKVFTLCVSVSYVCQAQAEEGCKRDNGVEFSRCYVKDVSSFLYYPRLSFFKQNNPSVNKISLRISHENTLKHTRMHVHTHTYTEVQDSHLGTYIQYIHILYMPLYAFLCAWHLSALQKVKQYDNNGG